MLRFAVFDQSGPANDWPIQGSRGAYLIGHDAVAVAGQIALEDGLLRCEPTAPESTGLVVFYARDALDECPPLAGGPAMALQTCLLPTRDQPYLLSLELARHRIMLCLNRFEDWGLFDLTPDDEVMRTFEQSRSAFTEALVRHSEDSGDPLETDALARRALSLALRASHHLTLLNADRQICGRLSGRLYADARAQAAASPIAEAQQGVVKSPSGIGLVLSGKPVVGCAVRPMQFGPQPCAQVAAASDFICLPMRWLDMEPNEGRYAFKQTDAWIEWAVRRARIPVVGGPVIDFHKDDVPEWLYIWENDYETLRELVYEHIRHLITRYRRTISRWTVASGLHLNDNFRFGLEQIMDLTRMCVLLARKLHPRGKVQIGVEQPFGEYYADNRQSIPPVLYAEMVQQAGILPDAWAIRLDLSDPERAEGSRDLAALSSLLDRYALLDRPLFLTIAGPLAAPAPSSSPQGAQQDRPSAGFDPDWVARLLGVAASKPYVHALCWYGLNTAAGSTGFPLDRYTRFRRALRAGRSPLANDPPDQPAPTSAPFSA